MYVLILKKVDVNERKYFANSNEEDIEEKRTHSGKVERSMKRDTVKLFQILKFFVRNFEDIETRLCLKKMGIFWSKKVALLFRNTAVLILERILNPNVTWFPSTKKYLLKGLKISVLHKTVMQTAMISKKIISSMRDSASTWRIVKNAKIFLGYVKHF